MKLLLALLGASLVAFQSIPRCAKAQVDEGTSAFADSQQTRALFRRGLAAYNSGQVETARQLFLQAWAIRPSADVAMELAQTEIDLTKYVDAAEHLDYALRNFTPSINEKMRNIAKQAHTEVLHHVARLTVTVSRADAEVLLNGRVVGKSPIVGRLYADAGNCVVQARLGSATVAQSLIAEAGEEYPVTLTIEPSKDADERGLPQEPLDARYPGRFSDASEARRSLVPVVVGGALTVVGFSAGLGLRLASNSAEDDASTLSASLGSQGCAEPNANANVCASLRHTLEKSDRERNWSTASFILASATLVGTAAYWFWPQKKARGTRGAVVVSGALGPSAGGLSVTGSL
jgi:tetratricopeptide (TPR) repeat protein